MSITYSPLSDADDSENQLAQVIKDPQELKHTAREPNPIVLKLEDDIEEQNAINLELEYEIYELNASNRQERAASLESPKKQTLKNDKPHQSNDGESYSYYRKPCSLVYISCGFIFLLTCLIWDRSYISRLISGDSDDFSTKYPDCTVNKPFQVGNGQCDFGEYNTEECGFDGGDCTTINQYLNCNVDDLSLIGNGQCDLGDYNTEECGFDGGDCTVNNKYPNCDVDDLSLIGNGRCDLGDYDTMQCGYDGGDCDGLHTNYPDCIFLFC